MDKIIADTNNGELISVFISNNTICCSASLLAEVFTSTVVIFTSDKHLINQDAHSLTSCSRKRREEAINPPSSKSDIKVMKKVLKAQVCTV